MKIPGELSEVCNNIATICPWNILAIVLIGSFSTAEGTFFQIHKDEKKSLSDYDLEILVKFYDPFLLKKANFIASQSNLKISIGIMPISQLSKLKMIQTYDMKMKGVFIIGNKELLDSIPMEVPSDIPKYEAIRRLLNSVMEMNEAIGSCEYLNSSKRSNLTVKIKYSIAKSYLACCTALLTLVGKYLPTYQERNQLFSKLFKSYFKELHRKYPSFPIKVRLALKFKLNTKSTELSEFPQEWFEARDYLLSTLKYVLSKYFRASNTNLFNLLKNLEVLPPKPFLNIAYALSLLFKKKIPPIRAFFITSMLEIQTAGVYLIKSINEDGSINEELLNKAREKIKKFYPINKRSIKDWNSIKNVIVHAWNIAPDYSMD
ncbi:hypothetical protein [Candidatus Borrarchaeum sp.]|uniref:hypothetical protein n=1 Tax=Candidatus Borrarchaeum sp. TaxID=2846742 RepID=UPI00258116C4|nr:hypothetical protein [Candidatus Borrarchaeum sp.]